MCAGAGEEKPGNRAGGEAAFRQGVCFNRSRKTHAENIRVMGLVAWCCHDRRRYMYFSIVDADTDPNPEPPSLVAPSFQHTSPSCPTGTTPTTPEPNWLEPSGPINPELSRYPAADRCASRLCILICKSPLLMRTGSRLLLVRMMRKGKPILLEELLELR